MDSITQGVLGAAIGEAILGKRVGNKAAIAGAIIATIPDLDVLLYLFYDSLDMLSIHRGFSHSIVGSLLYSFIISFILSRTKWFHDISFHKLLLFSWIVLITHILLDTFTAYGTQLLAPFSNTRFGLDSINVVDPVYTLPLLVGLVLGIWVFRAKPYRASFNKWGLIISTVYLLFTLCNKQLVKNGFEERLFQENISYTSLLTMPVGIGNINWYGVAKNPDSLYMQKHSIFGMEHQPFISFPINDHYLDEVDHHVADLMRWFAKGFYTVEKIDGKVRIYNLQVDMRGIVTSGKKRAPTRGYFEIMQKNGEMHFSSGSIPQME
jgi:inner membrane protein